ncbi:hypothetical protein QCD60_23025 [Pokkaliibacter sp. MBI-7]|uniref:hypothetical protein n=1 Tax=Pokkaliibacter sp. MBI-7 TaxID=3040600 RepID=UPI002446AE02|nr:hypothetical protein [Pokkaliibacter sp. MBI-7]MDH2435387.1 hypothetical protein [Pokkaliibacter sp. MBI-7]MDH2435394.1 hypothetical protein [Pokkaliibacter sp. MBI-7]MDH2435401.1 hypothetical protein [Pokkaliibacter sp. MBI-7]
MQLQFGEYVCGVVQDVISEPWSSDPTKFNHRVLMIRPYSDQYGNPQTDVMQIDIAAEEVQPMRAQLQHFRGQPALLQVVAQARSGGRNGAWLRRFKPKGANFIPFPSPADQKPK